VAADVVPYPSLTLVHPVTNTPGSTFFPFISVKCLETDVFLCRSM